MRSWQTHGGPRTQWKSGWRYYKSDSGNPDSVRHWNETDHLWAVVERLKAVQIENDDALKVVRRFDAPGTLFYVDPPYLLDTRSHRWRGRTYNCELSDDDHRRLAEVLHDVRGMVLLSGYPSQLYSELYPGWRTETIPVTTDHNGKAAEVLWLSPRLQAHVPQMSLAI